MAKYNPKWSKEVRLVPEHPNRLPAEIRNTVFKIVWVDKERGIEYCNMESDRNVRPLKTRTINKYRNDIENNTFVFNGSPICTIASNGKQTKNPGKQRLANGNHRAHAAAGLDDDDTGYFSLVLENISLEAEETWDRNLKRSIGQILQNRGETHPTVLASLVKWATAYEVYGIRWDIGRADLSDGEQELYFDDNADDLRWAAALAAQHRYRVDMYPSPFAFFIYLTAMLSSREKAYEFWIDYVVNTDSIPRTHPAQQLRHKLAIYRRSNERKSDYVTQTCLAFSAWNAWWSGADPVSGPWDQLKIPPKWNSENIPTLLPQSSRDKYLPETADDEDDTDE